MQAADDGADGAVGAARGTGGPQGQGGPEGPRGQGNPDASHCPSGQDGSGGGQDSGHSSQGDPNGQSGSDGTGGSADPGRPGSPSGASNEGAVSAPTDSGPQVRLAVRGCRPDGAAVPAVAGLTSGLIQFTLTVPFRSPLEAYMARRTLARYVTRHIGVIHQELTVNGSILAVWIAEDPVFFRASINTFLDHLCIVVQTMERFEPRVFH